MSSVRLAGELRTALSSPRPTDFIPELTASIHSYVAELSSFSTNASTTGLDETLQQMLHDEIDQQSIPHIQLVLAALDALDKTVSTESIILTWFDMLLRPSLKSRKLPSASQKHTRNVVLRALHDPSPGKQEIITGFQDRIMQLYLLDTSSISSGDELVEKMSWKEAERLQGISYKCNLETILVDFFEINPQEFIQVFLKCFEEPTWRLQLVLLLKCIAGPRNQDNSDSMLIILRHALPRLVKSLLIDTSSTLFNVTQRLCVQILPHLALFDAEQVPTTIPLFLIALQRGFCWTHHPPYRDHTWPHNPHLTTLPDEIKQSIQLIEGNDEAPVQETVLMPALHSSLSWKTLGSTFDTPGFAPPAPSTLLQFLMGMFPSNTLCFLRSPKQYISLHQPEPFFTMEWDQMVDPDVLKERVSPFIQKLRIPAGLIMLDDLSHTKELTDLTRWHNHSVASIVSMCAHLNTMQTVKGDSGFNCERGEANTASLPSASLPDSSPSAENLVRPSSNEIPQEPSTTEDVLSDTPHLLMPIAVSTWKDLPSHVAEALSSLQRENLLLKDELEFELWLKKQNSCHSDCLYKEATKLRAEIESESLKRHKTLAKYRRRYTEIQMEFKAHKEQASTSIHELKTWNKAQEDKVAEMRKKERAWSIEASTLKEQNNLREATIDAQNRLIEEARKKIFLLETEMKAMKPKIDRVADFEARAKQFEELQQLWDKDVQQFNAQASQMQSLIHDHRHMALQLASLEAANKELQARASIFSLHPPTSSPLQQSSKTSHEFVENLIVKVQSLEDANKVLALKCQSLANRSRANLGDS